MFDLPEALYAVVQCDAATHSVTSREGKHREFKQGFVQSDFSEYAKALAAFANTSGGVLVFGVSDRPRQIVGVDPTTIPDEASWASRLREDFDPEIVIATKVYTAGERSLFVVGLDASPHRPVICRRSRSKKIQDKKGNPKDVEVLREGTIYFRYAGQTRAIGFTELSAMLEDREKRRMQKIMEALKVVERVGFDRAGVIDLKAGDASSVFVSRETAKDLTFIDRANLVKDAGAPAYVVLGQVHLNNVVHAPLEEADKNLPGEVAAQLNPLVAETYGNQQSIHSSQVTKLLKHLGVHDDERHCVQERKLRRKYITRDGISAIENFIRNQPLEAIKAFGGRKAVARYEQGLQG